jgi:urease accessory protein
LNANAIPWLVLQLADSAFPAGGFAHSAGLEAALQLGEVRKTPESIGAWCRELIQATGSAVLPFVNSAVEEPERFSDWDRLNEAFLSNHVARAASRVQGRAFFSTCCQAFDDSELNALRERARAERLAQHFAPVFGAVCARLRIGLDAARQVFMYITVRGALSAAVRLNALGPAAAQRLQMLLALDMDRALDETAHLRATDAAQSAPLLELFQMHHDRLYSRLFQS